jgi:6-phosphogluconolactonase (cycloisomerase 2 family)
MKLSRFGRISMALAVSVAVGLGMTACGGGTIGFMWVLGTQYNQIAGFKIDDFTGNLTTTVGSPYPSGGTNPVSIVVKAGGRFVYVINKGNATAAGNISLFSVAGDGNLVFQQAYSSAGTLPAWATMDGGGNFLYVLDTLDPTNTPVNGVVPAGATGTGDVTVFASDSGTGRLSLVQNQQLKTPTGLLFSYFPVGLQPTMVKISGACLFTLNTGDSTLSPYSVGGSGQLVLPTNTIITTGSNSDGLARRLTSINTGGSYVYLTDASATSASPGGQVLPYTVGTNCALNTLTGGSVNNLALTANPANSFTDARGKYLYVLNQSTTNTSNANSTISAFTIDPSSGKLQPVSDSSNPYSVGSGPTCMVEDPTSQYLYTSNHADGTVTGKLINQNTGQISGLARGSTFQAAGLATCMTVSGNVQ